MAELEERYTGQGVYSVASLTLWPSLAVILPLPCFFFLSRYMDIPLGLILLTSLVSLEYGSMTGERPPLALFLILSLATMAVFWLWFLYLKYAKMESEASKEVRGGII